ncbi:glycosyltransferase [Pseudomonas psychrophila]|uniref:Glycosyltransferase involved in cell wall bisynthesis n=1 Tax=Pseudomonas psychrophila TaxID=122355 RepID=A0ABY0VUW8_9PSED|nr:glycosyltransferase [Pseudomonas psychrophila]KAB0489594.1 glycosyltransferase [Pseudomonas psychrophila]QIE33134.1 glycosyltransferase [Pseudomonas psychrophila]WVI99697.1 glycosyltransferase [Pseudomonas psychrophila]SDU57258.1 Glycosyltransferase involved in cell wall bisynthesis [Pseudomonas psychrophila]
MPRVLICGPYPDPIGGISIHIQRLATLLNRAAIGTSFCDESANKKENIFNIRSLNFIAYASLIFKSDIVHIHSSIGIFRLMHLLFAFVMRKKTIVTLHSWRNGVISSYIWSLLFNLLCSKIILVNHAISKRLKVNIAKQVLYPAFIPPLDVLGDLPIELSAFIASAKLQHKKIASSNAFRIVEHNRQDLYGLDLCIDAFSKKEISESAVLVFSISDPSTNLKKIECYLKIIAERKLEDVIYLQLGSINFYALLQSSDISIRATNTDGDALSIRESLFLNKPCIASDCTNRPEGTQLFKNRSLDSLSESILNALRAPLPARSNSGALQEIENFYLKLYTDF